MDAASKGVKDLLSAFEEAESPAEALLLFSRQLQLDYNDDENIDLYIFGIRTFFCFPAAAELRSNTEAAEHVRSEWIKQNDAIYDSWLSSTDDAHDTLKWEKWTFQAKNMILDEFLKGAITITT